MSRSLALLLLALTVCTVAHPFDDVKSIIKSDECTVKGLETIKPKIEAKIRQIKEVRINLYRIKRTSLLKLSSWL